MSGKQEIERLKAGGFTDAEIAQWAETRRATLSDAGFGQDEIDQYFGRPAFNAAPVKKLAEQNRAALTSANAEGAATVKPVTNWTEAIEAGLQMSVSGLLARGKKPDLQITEDAPRLSRIASNVASLAGDVPFMVGGYLAGGGQVTGTAGAFALPAGMRKVLMDKYDNGEAQSFGDFWDRFSGAFLETAKGWITGAATGAVGKAAGALPIESQLAKGAAVTTAEVATMVSVGSALEGQVPEPNDFVDAAIVLGFVKGSAGIAKKLRHVYQETGVRPDKIIEDAAKDPTIKTDLSAANMMVPRAYDQALRPRPLGATAVAEPNEQRPTKESDGSALAQIGDHISTVPQTKKATTWQDVYTKAVDDLNPIRESVKKAQRMMGRSLDQVEQVDGELVNEPAPLRERVLLAGDTPLEIEGPKATALAELKASSGQLSEEFVRARTDSPTGKVADAESLADPYKLMRLVRGSMGKASHFLEHGTVDFRTFATNGESLRDIVKPIKDMDGFRNYIVAQRAVELHGRGIESGITPDLASAAVKEGAGRFKKHADRLIQYQNRVTQYLRDSGIISAEQYDAMLEANKFYVPFFRLIDSQSGSGEGVNVRNPIKAIKGSEKMILDPLESIIKNTYVYTALAERNAAGQAFIKMADKTGDSKLFYRKVPPESMKIDLTEPEIRRVFREFVEIRKTESTKRTTAERTTSSERTATTQKEGGGEPDSKAFTHVKNRVMEALKARGFAQGEADQMIDRLMQKGAKPSATTETVTETVERVAKEVERTVYEPELNIRLPHKAATIFRAIREPLRPNEMAVFENGKRNVYALDRDVAAAFKSLDSETANLFVKIIAIPAKTLRAGAVLSPDFMARNALRDQLSAFVLSKGGYFPVFDFVRGAMSLIKKDEAFGNWLKAGGANSAMVSVDRQYLREHLFQLTKETGLMERAWNVAKSPLEVLRITSELVENSTRLGEFKRLTNDTTNKAGLQEAAFSSREVTLDFARIGANMRAVNMISAFTNAQVQGLDRVVRGFTENPIGMSAKIGASITLPSLLLWWANHDDPRWGDIPRWQKDLFWIVMTKDHIYRIPKPFELGLVFGTLPERSMEQFFSDDPVAFRDFEKSMIDAFTPNLVPQIAQPIIEQFSNKSLFTGMPIVQSSAEKLLPEYQYNPYTTELAKALGSLIGAFPGMESRAVEDQQTFLGGVARALSTPALIENYTRAWTGGLGAYAIQLADKALRVAGALPDPVLPTATLSDIPVVKAFMVRYPSANAQSIQDFYSKFEVQERYQATLQSLLNEGDMRATKLIDEHSDKMVDLSSMRDTLTDQNKLIRLIYKNPDMGADEKRQLIDTIYGNMIEIAKGGNEIMRDIERETGQ